MSLLLIFWIGFALFVLAQAQNSLLARSNPLRGLEGLKIWFAISWVNLATRIFFSAIFYHYLIQVVASKLAAAGFHMTSTAITGTAGYCASALLWQAFGLLPWLRSEIPANEAWGKPVRVNSEAFFLRKESPK